MPTMIEKFQGNFAKPKPKRQDTRKRSPKACLSCRARKVRCDVAFVHDSCTNCVLDSKKCVVSWRRNNQQRRHIEKPDASEKSVERLAKPLQYPKEHEDTPAVLTDECFGTPKLAEARPCRTTSYDHTQARTEITFAYYPFLCISNLSSLHTDHVKYLESQGCFRVPESRHLDDLIRTFFRYAHPILPVINEAEFWSIYDPLISDGNTNRIPVILLSAMMFVACKYVGEHTLEGMQLRSVHEAREIFLQKTQLLYDRETESSPLVLAQISLLLTHWTSQRSSRSSRQSAQWLGRAIHHSQDAISQAKLWSTLKIHYNQSNLRRLLGCCILSDCIHSLYTRRPLTMPPCMVEAGSDCPVLSRADLSHEIGRSRVYGVEAKQKLIEAQEHMSALINIIRRVLTLVYPQDRLRAWYSESCILPISARDSALGPPVSPGDGGENGSPQHDPVELLASMMHLHYQTAMLALYQSELLRVMANPRATCSAYRPYQQSPFREQKRHYLNCVTNMVDRVSDSLQHQHLSKVPETIILCTALPLFLHLLDSKVHLQSPLSSNSQAINVQSCCPDWVQRVMECLRLYFRNDLEYILQAIKAANNTLAQSLQERHEAQITFSREDDAPKSSEGQLQMGSWSELLDARPSLFARLIERLDVIISWGGELPETDMTTSFNDCQVPTGSAQTRKFRAAEISMAMITPVSPAPSRRSIERRSPPTSHGNEPATQLDAATTDSGFLNSDGLHDGFNNPVQPYLNDAPGDAVSPVSLDHVVGFLVEEIAGGGRCVPGQLVTHEEVKPTAVDSIDTDDMALGDGLSDDWIDALLEKEISLQCDNTSRNAEDLDMDTT